MSDFYSLKQVILGCVARTSKAFVAGSTNFVDVAINNAVIYAQRRVDFEWNKGVIVVPCATVGSLLNALDENGEPVKVKKIIKAFGAKQPTIGDSTSVPYLSRVSQIADDTTGRLNHCCCSGNRVVHEGLKVFHAPEINEAHNLYFYAVKWLPRLVADEDTNFLLEQAFDFLMYRSILELNFFIKEDERFQVSKVMLEDAWQSVITWDASLVSPTETEIEL